MRFPTGTPDRQRALLFTIYRRFYAAANPREILASAVAALRALAAYFGDGPSELRAIADEAERRIGLAVDRGPASSAPRAPPTEEAAADGPAAPEPQAATAEPALQRTPPPTIGGEGAGWEWVMWMRAGFRDGSVPVNAAGAWSG